MHQVIFKSFPKRLSISDINNYVEKYVNSHGDRYGTTRVNVLDYAVCGNYEEAYDKINSARNGGYEGWAVKFYDYSNVTPTKRVNELMEKKAETERNREAYINAHSVRTLKANLIGCQKCGSKLRKDFLKANYCPVCHSDLRSETTLETIKRYNARIENYEKMIAEEKKKQKKQAKIMWLVKFEYHC